MLSIFYYGNNVGKGKPKLSKLNKKYIEFTLVLFFSYLPGSFILSVNSGAPDNEYTKLATAASLYLCTSKIARKTDFKNIDHQLKKVIETCNSTISLNLRLRASRRLHKQLPENTSNIESIIASLTVVGTKYYLLDKIPMAKTVAKEFNTFFKKNIVLNTVGELIKGAIEQACLLKLIHFWKNKSNS
ncbi:MAG: hypothetical protein WCD44_04720 [Candidatus Babeliales bacterium]